MSKYYTYMKHFWLNTPLVTQLTVKFHGSHWTLFCFKVVVKVYLFISVWLHNKHPLVLQQNICHGRGQCNVASTWMSSMPYVWLEKSTDFKKWPNWNKKQTSAATLVQNKVQWLTWNFAVYWSSILLTLPSFYSFSAFVLFFCLACGGRCAYCLMLKLYHCLAL